MKPTWCRTLCLSAFALLLVQGALLNCIACGHTVEPVVAQIECANCQEHEQSDQAPCHRCEIHPQVEVLHPSRLAARAYAIDFVPAPRPLDIVALQSRILLLVPKYTAPPDPGWRDVGITIIRC